MTFAAHAYPSFPSMGDFRRLKAWEKAHTISIDVHHLARRMPSREGAALRGQLQRSALSVAATIAEGAGKTTDAEFARYVDMALGSASETMHHLLTARDLELLSSEDYQGLFDRVEEVRRMLSGLLKRLRPDDRSAPS